MSSSEQWLAVLDGRFLPVEEISISVENDTKDVLGTNVGSAQEMVVSTIVTVDIVTPREPALKDSPQQLRLYSRSEEYLIWNIAAQVGREIAFGTTYKLTVQGTELHRTKQIA